MPSSSQNALTITTGIQEVIDGIDPKQSERMIHEIMNAGRIFVFGAGRSGLVGKAFAMRLVHLGKLVYFVGGTTTPAITENDVLVIISGSGKTSSVHHVAQVAKDQGSMIIALTVAADSPIGKLSQVVVRFPIDKKRDGDKEKKDDYLARQIMDTHKKLTPLGTLFELSVMVYFDSIIPILMERMDVSEQYMKKRHTNLE